MLQGELMKAKKPNPGDVPRCADCNAGVFKPGEQEGECRLLPMQWIAIEDGLVARYHGAVRHGWCRHFQPSQVH
jgi:hypothetical protein